MSSVSARASSRRAEAGLCRRAILLFSASRKEAGLSRSSPLTRRMPSASVSWADASTGTAEDPEHGLPEPVAEKRIDDARERNERTVPESELRRRGMRLAKQQPVRKRREEPHAVEVAETDDL